MSDLFGEGTIDIDLFYVVEKSKNGSKIVRTISEDEAVKMKADPEKKDLVKTNRFNFTQLTWAANNALLQKATTYNFQKNESELDYVKLRDGRFKAILRGWDLKDAQGNALPLTEQAIDRLQPAVIFSLLEKYELAMAPDKEEISKN